MCQACHGTLGLNEFPNIPNLKYQNRPYLVQQLQYYKDGTRQNATMSKVAALLSAEDINYLASFFSQTGQSYDRVQP